MPIRHRMKLTERNFTDIKDGNKTFEFRLNDAKRKALRVGERIEFAKLPELTSSLIAEITSLDVYVSFLELYDQLRVAVRGISPDEFIQAMRAYYSPEEENKYGVIAIGLRRL